MRSITYIKALNISQGYISITLFINYLTKTMMYDECLKLSHTLFSMTEFTETYIYIYIYNDDLCLTNP